jgi:hypothetical protein
VTRISTWLLCAGTGALLVSAATLPAISAPIQGIEVASRGALVQTAAKKKAKPAKKAADKSCGTFKYTDKKSGKCVDARDKKK